MEFASIDFETANEQRNSACAIGVAIVENGTIVARARRLIRPVEQRFSSFCTAVHGIAKGDLLAAATFPDVWAEMSSLIGRRLLVAHNAAFDMSVLRATLQSHGIAPPEHRYLCSLKLASRAWPTLKSHRLSALAAHHAIELDHHNPESDAAAAAELVLIAAREQTINCPLALAKKFRVAIGDLSTERRWRPTTNEASPVEGFR